MEPYNGPFGAPKLYIAGPLFSAAEQAFNRSLKALLSERFQVYLPQEDGELLVNMVARGNSVEAAGREIFAMDVNAIRACDVLLIVLDGRSVDEGAAFELGVAFSLGKLCLGLQTDVRRLLPWGNNPMVQHAVTRIFRDVAELSNWRFEPGVSPALEG